MFAWIVLISELINIIDDYATNFESQQNKEKVFFCESQKYCQRYTRSL